MERDREYKRTQRFTKRLEVTFSSGVLSYRGILSNVSVSGLFIRTNRGFAPGTTVDIELMLPDNTVSSLKGIVRRTFKNPLTTMKNGMGVELIRQDAKYQKFIKPFLDYANPETEQEIEISPDPEAEPEKPPVPEFQIIACPNCGAKNKVLINKLSLGPKCGKCGTPLPAFQA
jgi:PilZ domain